MANRLAGHPSPYLEQHADNPVDWWPWCDEAFAEARRRDVPIFLSIGYATCHWCHVMAHESFEDPEVAALLNEAFVCIKVDREERPDIDEAYMAVCQAMNGSGGWPLTALLDHDKRAWFAGTYFPKHGRGRRPGMMELVPHMADAWSNQRDEVDRVANSVAGQLAAVAHRSDVPPDALEQAAKALEARFDPQHGGFGGAPKFPSPHQITLALQTRPEMAYRTLDAIAAGGIHDHVGGGFHRYATDVHWLLPHFEKMLYDQATLLEAFTQAWQLTQEPRYQAVCQDLIEYVVRDMRHADGGFFSAEDADSEGVEGRFYVWDHDELPADLAAAFGAKPQGNHHDEATREPAPTNILHVAPGTDTRPWRPALDALRIRRDGRVRPLRDEKILADWNGLWITSLTRAAMAFQRPDWLDTAQAAGRFCLANFTDPPRHRWRDGALDDHAFLDDHAALGLAFTTLFEATGESAWLDAAIRIGEGLQAFQRDGRFHTVAATGEMAWATRGDGYDGAIPSGNTVAIEFLGRLGRITAEAHWSDVAWRCAESFGPDLETHPAAYTGLVQAIASLDAPEIVVVGDAWPAVWSVHVPGAVRLMGGGAGWLAEYRDPGIYVCRDQTCEQPVTSLEALRSSLAPRP